MSGVSPDHTVDPPPADGDERAWRTWAQDMPVSRALGIVCDAIDAEQATFTVAAPLVRNSRGWIHGGVLLAVADQCAGIAAIRSAHDHGTASTASFSAQFLRPTLAPATITARVMRRGRTMVFVELTIADADGRICTVGQATLINGDGWAT